MFKECVTYIDRTLNFSNGNFLLICYSIYLVLSAKIILVVMFGSFFDTSDIIESCREPSILLHSTSAFSIGVAYTTDFKCLRK